MKRPSKFILHIVLMVVVSSLLWTTALYYSQSNIHNSQLLSSKYEMEMQPMGAKESRFSRAVLSGLQLNLQKFYGHQQYILTNAHNVKSLFLKFKTNTNSYLDVVYGVDEAGYYGVRMGTYSFFFRSDKAGKFTEKSEIPLNITEQDVHSAKIFQSEKTLELTVDKKHFSNGNFGRLDANQVGLRSGLLGAIVLKISYLDVSGNKEIEFMPTGKFWEVFGKNCLILVALCFLLATGLKVFKFVSEFKSAYRKSLQFFVISGAIWLGFDFFYYSRLEFGLLPSGWISVDPTFPFIQPEDIRYRFFLGWAELVEMPLKRMPDYEKTLKRKIERCESLTQTCEGAAIEAGFKNEIKTDYSILFLGGSFGKGSGAGEIDQTFFRQTHRLLAEKLAKKNKTIQSFNVGLIHGPGFDDFEVVDKVTTFNKFLNNRHYDVLVVTFLRFYPEDLQLLRNFFSGLRQKNTKVIFLTQPYDPEKIPLLSPSRPKDGPDETAAIFLKENNIETLDLISLFESPTIRGTGSLWSDFIHLSSYGQEVVATTLAPLIEANLN